MRFCILFLLLIIFGACNSKLLVNKRMIVREENGYLVFFKEEVSYYKYTDTVDTKFLASQHKDGFKLDNNSIEWLNSLAKKYAIIIFNQEGRTAYDSISVIPVQIRYYLGDIWREAPETNTISYKWNNSDYHLKYKVYDFRKILMISARRKEDVNRIEVYKPDME